MEGSLMIVYEFNGKKECNNLMIITRGIKTQVKGE